MSLIESKYLIRSLTFLLISLLSQSIFAEKIIMVRSKLAFPEAMTALQISILKHGYQISRVQRVDIGLTKSNFKTDKYRVVFFGKQKELEVISKVTPSMVAYLPLKMAIFAEGEQTLLVTVHPDQFADMFPNPKLKKYFKRWQQDIRSIFATVVNSQ